MTDDTPETFSQDGYAPYKTFAQDVRLMRHRRAWEEVERLCRCVKESGCNAHEALWKIWRTATDMQDLDKEIGQSQLPSGVRGLRKDSSSEVDGSNASTDTTNYKPSDFCLHRLPYQGVNSPASWGFK